MSNGEVCCILGVCCPPGSAAQREALAHEIQKQRPNFSEEHAQKAADKVLAKYNNFADLASLLDDAVA
jgi:hypothetical protein